MLTLSITTSAAGKITKKCYQLRFKEKKKKSMLIQEKD